MKKIFFYLFFLTGYLFYFSSTVLADEIPPDSHQIKKCVKIVNLDKFPNIVLIGHITGPMVKDYETYQINNNECLTKGYKFNSFKIYWNTKDNSKLIDANNLLITKFDPNGGYVYNGNPLVSNDIEYSIAGFSGGKPVLYKSKEILKYNDGTPDEIKMFSNPLEDKNNITPIPTVFPIPVKRGFWSLINCFFKTLFGKDCQ